VTQRNPDQPVPSSSLGLFLCRLGWFLLAPAAMFAIAMGIAQADSAAMTKLDLAYLLTACLAITLRWISFLGGDLTDAFGDPSSTTASVKSHSIRMAMISVVLWGLVKGIAAY
jgi:hypothetical protein